MLGDEPQPGPSTSARCRIDNPPGMAVYGVWLDYVYLSFICLAEIDAPPMRYCRLCDENVEPRAYVGHLRSNRHLHRRGGVVLDNGVVSIQTAFKSRIASYRVGTLNYHLVVAEFMSDIKNKVLTLIERKVGDFRSVKVNFELFGYFVLESKDLAEIKSFNTRNEIASVGTDIGELYDDFSAILDEKVSEFTERESGI